MIAYYNDNDPRVAAWLRELIAAGLLPPGDVDERSIADVAANDLQGYTQVHFFAGIGGWPYALRLAGWPDDRPVWTGSCPCQPFSCAGARKGERDPRHLWPEFRRFIAECRPSVVFGEQVASKDGRLWLAGVRTDLEALGYPAGPQICALRASARRTSGKGFSGWPSPGAQDDRRGAEDQEIRRARTCHGANLTQAASLAGWPTPMAGSPATEDYNEAGNTDSGRRTVELVSGWATPKASDGQGGRTTKTEGGGNAHLDIQARIAGWPTPLGPAPSGSPAETAKPAGSRLNPRFSLWLMGYPDEWASCGERAMQSCRRSRRSS